MAILRRLQTVIGLLASAAFVFATICPMLTTDIFWVRLFDFPRLHFMAIGLVGGLALFGAPWPSRGSRRAIQALVAIGLGWQAMRVIPYTPIAEVEVRTVSRDAAGERIRVLACNVYQHNERHELIMEQIRKEEPDLVLLMEVNEAWQRTLTALHERYPHRIVFPLENTWGIALYSVWPLEREDVHYYASEERPAIRTLVTLPSEKTLYFLGLHPAPPGYKPPDGERVSSAPRDHTLMMAAREAGGWTDTPVIVAGDFNDAAWSRMTRKFQEVSGLLDPRVGRGLFNTYNANSAFLRYPIDHVFLSSHFDLVEMRCLPHVGSDHFPMFVDVLLREPE